MSDRAKRDCPQPRTSSTSRTFAPSSPPWKNGGAGNCPRHGRKRILVLPLFSLSSRSGSTLLRVILAGNPQLFAPPELHLLYYSTTSQRHQALANQRNEHLLSGAIRAVMQLRSCGVEQATALLQSAKSGRCRYTNSMEFFRKCSAGGSWSDKTPTCRRSA